MSTETQMMVPDESPRETGIDECAVMRRKQLDEYGPDGCLEKLKGAKGKRRHLSWADQDFWIKLTDVVAEDSQRLLRIRISEGEDFADAVFVLPGFVVTAHIHPDALFGYLRMLLQELWPDKIHWDARHRLAVWLFEAYRRRVKVPKTWDEGGWRGLC